MFSGLDLMVINAAREFILSTSICGYPIGLYTVIGSGSLMFTNLYLIKKKHDKGRKS